MQGNYQIIAFGKFSRADMTSHNGVRHCSTTMAAAERTLESLSNRLLDLDGIIAEREMNMNHVTEEETHSFIESKKNKATVKKTDSDVKKVKEWLFEDGEIRDLEEIPPKELAVLLSRFLLSTKKNKPTSIKDSDQFEPSTLRGILGSVMRYLVVKDFPVDIFSR